MNFVATHTTTKEGLMAASKTLEIWEPQLYKIDHATAVAEARAALKAARKAAGLK
jgi:hypothetical protein